MTKAHTSLVVTWRNDPSIRKNFVSQANFTAESHDSWLAKRRGSDTDINWIIENENGHSIGAVSLYNIDWVHKRAEFGRFVIGDREARGCGYGKLALQLVLDIAAEAGLEEVYLEVKTQNLRAIALYEQAGFKRQNEESMIAMSLLLSRLDSN
jgi:RimJ/RimL family protein N-acetyltransferase